MTAPELVFGDPETIAVSELRVGDFVVRFPAQPGIRGATISSGVVSIETNYDRWTRSTGYRRRRLSVESRKVRFADPRLREAELDVPADLEIVVRRPIRDR